MVVVGREEEYLKLKRSLDAFMDTGEGGIVYVSGVPGSGKTYTISRLLDSQNVPHLFLNVTAFRTRREIYKYMLTGLSCIDSLNGSYLSQLRDHFTRCNALHVVVVDEVDLLVSKKQEILYNVFDMPYLDGSKLLLFLVSNTMDLPERLFEPKVCSRIGKKRINFVPYTAAQLQNIVRDFDVDRMPMELASKRIGSVSGDARRIIDVVNRAKECKEGKVEMFDIDTVMKSMYTPLYVHYLRKLTFYQKIVLSLVRGFRKSRISVKDVYEDFTLFCAKIDAEVVDFLVFHDILGSLVSYGMFKYRNCRKEVVPMILVEEIDRALLDDEEYTKLFRKGIVEGE